MKKISVWMIALLLVPGIVLLTGCKKNEENTEVEQPAGEPMAEATPTPAMEAPAMEATPAMAATPGAEGGAMGGAMASPTPSPAAQ